MYQKWEILKASVKFEDSEEIKDRPILVLHDNGTEVIAYKVTSKDRGATLLNYEIKEWVKSGLDKKSFVIIPNYLKIKKSKVLSKYGDLQYRDIFGLEKFIRDNT